MWSNYSTRRNISDETIVRKSGGVGGVIEGRIGHIKMSSLLSDDVLWLFRVFGVWLGFIGLFFDDIYRWLMMYSTFHFFFLISDTFFRIFFFFSPSEWSSLISPRSFRERDDRKCAGWYGNIYIIRVVWMAVMKLRDREKF